MRPWFYAVQHYGRLDIPNNGKVGKSFDDLNAVKLYFKLRELSAAKVFADGEQHSNAETVQTADARFKDALQGISRANDTYAIKASTLEGAAGGWWHKASYVNQMWCDGQYMGPALMAQLLNEYGGYSPITSDDWALVVRQFTIAWRYLWDNDVCLLYHAFTADPANTAGWAGISGGRLSCHAWQGCDTGRVGRCVPCKVNMVPLEATCPLVAFTFPLALILE